LRRARERNRTQGNDRQDRFEREKIRFHHRVRKGYLSLAKKEAGRVKVIDTRQGEEKVFEEIRAIVDQRIRKRNFRSQI
jgi:dTMP kinase